MLKDLKKVANEHIDGRAETGFEKVVLRTKAIYEMSEASINHETAREIAFFILNHEYGLENCKEHPEQMEEILDRVADWTYSHLWYYGHHTYIQDTYSEEVYQKHKQDWEEYKSKTQTMRQIKFAVKRLIKPDNQEYFNLERIKDRIEFMCEQKK
ncbi:laminin-binding protein [Bacillus cereus group sp. MYBK106-1]|uniref:laminin-binding protein n=1 Tax=unclassified Bacillus cereus group TaxID=2750818 RepID=UPI003F798EF7